MMSGEFRFSGKNFTRNNEVFLCANTELFAIVIQQSPSSTKPINAISVPKTRATVNECRKRFLTTVGRGRKPVNFLAKDELDDRE